jgi:hypothetical protein
MLGKLRSLINRQPVAWHLEVCAQDPVGVLTIIAAKSTR